MMDASATGVVGAVINVGFSALVGWYLLTKALPRIHEEHTQAQNTARGDFLASMREHRDAFHIEIKAIREHADIREQRHTGETKATLAQILAHCERELARRDEAMRAEMGVINNTLRNLLEAIEEWRDERRADRKTNA